MIDPERYVSHSDLEPRETSESSLERSTFFLFNLGETNVSILYCKIVIDNRVRVNLGKSNPLLSFFFQISLSASQITM